MMIAIDRLRSPRRVAAAAVLAAICAAAHLPAQGMVSVERLEGFHPAERAAWVRYIERSVRQARMGIDSTSAELARSGRSNLSPAPSGAAFQVTGQMTPAWFRGAEARRIAESVLSYQTPGGGWAARVDHTRGPRAPGESFGPAPAWESIGTFQDGATTEHLRFLLLADRAGPDGRYRRAFLRGLEYVLAAQFPSGCWPQAYPLRTSHHDAVTFHDGTMPRVIRLLRDVARGEARFVPGEARARAAAAAERGIGCITETQVVVDGRRTGWGQQHDPLDPHYLTGTPLFERPALATRESTAVLELLMEVDAPGPAVVSAIRGAAGWLRETMQWGYTVRLGEKPVAAPGAGPRWARYYEVGSNRALFTNRDTQPRHDWRELADSAWRHGWFTDQPARVLQRYAEWSRARTSNDPPVRAAGPSAVVDARHAGADGERVDGVPVYRTIGAALAAAPADAGEPYAIHVRAGRYREKLSVDRPNVHLIGDGRDETVLTYDVAAGHLSPGGWPYGTRGSWTLRVAAPGFRLEGMTVENAFDFMANAAKAEGDSTRLRGTQAVAVMLDEGSDRAVFRDCRLSGHQDTLFPNAGRSYFHRCEILGSVDFIFGAGRAVFEECDIVSRDRGSATNNGYITAPSTPITQPYGFFFVRSRLRKETPSMAPGSVTLGRPWHPSGRPDAIGSAVFIDTWMDDHVGAAGWSPMTSTDAMGNRVEHRPEEARFFEHGSTGPGAVRSPSRRVLTPAQAAEYTIARVLDGWDPRS